MFVGAIAEKIDHAGSTLSLKKKDDDEAKYKNVFARAPELIRHFICGNARCKSSSSKLTVYPGLINKFQCQPAPLMITIDWNRLAVSGLCILFLL